MHTALIYSVIGSILGIAGGVAGTYFALRNSNGPRERAFIIRASVVCWTAMVVFLCAMAVFPAIRPVLWGCYGIMLPLVLRYGNRKLTRVKAAEKK